MSFPVDPTQPPRFLTFEEILKLHEEGLRLYGGETGVRDPGLVESALSQPRAQFGGQFLHETIPSMAAAYLFHLVKNHGFIDGNKRIGALAVFSFLRDNGFRLAVSQEDFEHLTLRVASGETSKADATAFFERHVRKADTDM